MKNKLEEKQIMNTIDGEISAATNFISIAISDLQAKIKDLEKDIKSLENKPEQRNELIQKQSELSGTKEEFMVAKIQQQELTLSVLKNHEIELGSNYKTLNNIQGRIQARISIGKEVIDKQKQIKNNS